ncbi:hypothetical protein BHE90_005145 [Fusarium euwallaceae]|uniref:Uncharacterized protein n=1 Tax=Fusarium euwallaceae TaxID=1147111 RepID=A0A430LX76_9HYPO|nr:hypothetical protein BHE90_005145 [Fusarium euwallaceae]
MPYEAPSFAGAPYRHFSYTLSNLAFTNTVGGDEFIVLHLPKGIKVQYLPCTDWDEGGPGWGLHHDQRVNPELGDCLIYLVALWFVPLGHGRSFQRQPHEKPGRYSLTHQHRSSFGAVIPDCNIAEDVLCCTRNAPIGVKESHTAVCQPPRPPDGQAAGDH